MFSESSYRPMIAEPKGPCSPARALELIHEMHTRRGGLDVAVIDHLHHLAFNTHEEVRHEVGRAALAFKNLARELDCCVILLAQLSRGQGGEHDKRPTLAALREAGAIEEVADAVALAHAPYRATRKDEDRGKLILYVDKSRHGEAGTVHLKMDRQTLTIEPVETR